MGGGGGGGGDDGRDGGGGSVVAEERIPHLALGRPATWPAARVGDQ